MGRVAQERHVWPVLPSRVGTPFLILGVLPQGSITPFLSLFCLKNGIFRLSRGKKTIYQVLPHPSEEKIPDFSRMPSDALLFWKSKRFFFDCPSFFGENFWWGTTLFTNFEVLPQGSIIYFYRQIGKWVPSSSKMLYFWFLVLRVVLVVPCQLLVYLSN